MILPVDEALRDYLIENMASVTKSKTVLPVYRNKYPEKAAEACVMLRRQGGDPGGTAYLDYGSIEVWARHRSPDQALKLSRNLDLMLQSLVRKNLNTEVRMVGCTRNAGPERMDQEANDLARYYALYSFIASETL